RCRPPAGCSAPTERPGARCTSDREYLTRLVSKASLRNMSSERRHLTSPTELRALSHPTRLTILTLLDEEGPLTATEAGERIGESPANASFHLRTLAKYGYVEEAAGGRGRHGPRQSVARGRDNPRAEV